MIHFLYLLVFAICTGLVMGAIQTGDTKTKVMHGLKIFGQFTLVSLAMAWVFYFLPW